MSSPLAFDKQGNPFSFHRRTRQLRVRLFRNPSARGTCSQVLDADGSPLHIDADTEYPVFRQLVGNVPGLYRLDQCDDDGTEVDDAPPAYITIDPPRNAQGQGAGSDDVSALAVIREMAAVQREMAAIQGQALKALADNHAQILASAAEVMRAPRPAPAPAELRNAADDDDRNDDGDEGDGYEDDNYEDSVTEEEQSSGAVGLIAQLVKMIDPKDARKLGSWLMAKYMQFRQETATAAQPVAVNVATPPVNVATAPVSVVAVPVAPTATQVATPTTAAAHAAAPIVVQVVPAPVASSPTSSSTMAAPAPTMSAPDVVVASSDVITREVNVPTSSTTSAESATSEPTETSEPRGTGQIPSLTQEQLVHIAMINAQLSPEEQGIAEQVMRRMGAATMQRWLIELTAMSVDDATATVRQAIAERSQRRPKMTR